MIILGFQLVTISSDFRAMTSSAQNIIDEMKEIQTSNTKSDSY